MKQLLVCMNNHQAGILTEKNPGKGYTFKYYDEYLASTMPPVSVSFPKRKEEYESDLLFPFFGNMLPEGANRKAICRSNKIDENDLFELLSTMADKDFIGAVNIRRMNHD